MHARYYSAADGRFLSPDVAQISEKTRSVDFGRYGYASDNPMRYYDPTGEATAVFMIGAGDDLFEKYGHSAIYIVDQEGRRGGVSYGGMKDFSEGLLPFVRGYAQSGRWIAGISMNTSAEQEAKMLQFIKKEWPNFGNDPDAFGGQSMIRENCAQAVVNTLQAGGVIGEDEQLSMVFGLSMPQAVIENLQQVEGVPEYSVFFIEAGELSEEVTFALGVLDSATTPYEEVWDSSD